jgi:N utilization substance protein B
MQVKSETSRHKQRQTIIEILYQIDMGVLNFEKTEEAFVDTAVASILDLKETIDETIESVLIGYTLKRISTVDRAILRLATYEMLETQTPFEIIIDEALNLTHTYTDLGDHKSVSFNNKVLDSIQKKLRGAYESSADR